MVVREITPTECGQFVLEALAETELVPQVPVDVVVAAMADWTLAGIFSPTGELAGVVGCDGAGEMHVHIHPAWHTRWQPRRTLREAFAIVLARVPTVHVTVPRENVAAQKLARLVQAELQSETATHVSYTLSRSTETGTPS